MTTKKLMSEQVIEDLQDFAAKPQGFVILQGLNGRGKSYAAMHIYEKNTPYKLPAFDYDSAWFITQADLHLKLIEAHELYGNTMQIVKQACNSKLLILDDLGTRIPTDSLKEFLYAVIDSRYKSRETKGTIITTNLDSTRFRKDFGDAIFSRVASGRNYVFLGLDRRFAEIGF